MKIFCLVLVFLIFVPQPVSAYLDPGFGSMVWQMIAAVGFGLAFVMKTYWRKIKNIFVAKKNVKPKE